jgi:hypothetical protein
VKLDLEVDPTVIDPSVDRQAGYRNSVLAHVSDTMRMYVAGRVVDLPSDSFIWVVEDRDWGSRIDSRRRWLVDSRGNIWIVGGTAGIRRWRSGRFGRSDNGCRQRRGR